MPSAQWARSFGRSGYGVVHAVQDGAACARLIDAVESVATGIGSRRLIQNPVVRAAAFGIAQHPEIANVLPADAVVVQCTLFSKGRHANWSVAPHQDLSIPVAERVGAAECAGWSMKEGVLYTQPPASVLASLVAVRLQLDPDSALTGPLQVVPGSHRFGRLSAEGIAAHVVDGGRIDCVVLRGGAVVIRPLIVHASGRAAINTPRRVLHFLFGPPALPFGLRWAEAVAKM